MAEHTEPSKPKEGRLYVNLSTDARAIVDGIRDNTGVSHVEAMSRILEWFASLDRKLRLAVLSRDEGTRRELTRLVLLDMAGVEAVVPDGCDVTVEQAVRVARAMLDRVELLTATGDPVRKDKPDHAPNPGRRRAARAE